MEKSIPSDTKPIKGKFHQGVLRDGFVSCPNCGMGTYLGKNIQGALFNCGYCGWVKSEEYSSVKHFNTKEGKRSFIIKNKEVKRNGKSV